MKIKDLKTSYSKNVKVYKTSYKTDNNTCTVEEKLLYSGLMELIPATFNDYNIITARPVISEGCIKIFV